MLSFKGRGYHNPTFRTTLYTDGVIVRTDCEQNPEVWSELRIPMSMLEAWTQAIRTAQAAAKCLHVVQESMLPPACLCEPKEAPREQTT